MSSGHHISIRVPVSVRGVGIFGTVGIVFSVLVYKDWITLAQAQSLFGVVKAAFETYGWLGYFFILTSFAGLFAYHEYLWYFIVRQKNDEIRRIVEQRNRLEDIILKKRGTSGFDEH